MGVGSGQGEGESVVDFWAKVWFLLLVNSLSAVSAGCQES